MVTAYSNIEAKFHCADIPISLVQGILPPNYVASPASSSDSIPDFLLFLQFGLIKEKSEIDGKEIQIYGGRGRRKQRFFPDHYGPAKVDFWKDPMSPSRWIEEHASLLNFLQLFDLNLILMC